MSFNRMYSHSTTLGFWHADRIGTAIILQYINVLAKEHVRVAGMNESLYIASKVVTLSFDRFWVGRVSIIIYS